MHLLYNSQYRVGRSNEGGKEIRFCLPLLSYGRLSACPHYSTVMTHVECLINHNLYCNSHSHYAHTLPPSSEAPFARCDFGAL